MSEAARAGPIVEAYPALEAGGHLAIPAANVARLIAEAQAAGAVLIPPVAAVGILYLSWTIIHLGSSNNKIPPVINVPASLVGTVTPTSTTTSTTSSAKCPEKTSQSRVSYSPNSSVKVTDTSRSQLAPALHAKEKTHNGSAQW